MTMFDPSMKPPTALRTERKEVKVTTWASMNTEDLVQCYDEVRTELVARGQTSLKTMNMEEELVLQYRDLRRLQAKVIDDDSVPPNQKAQVANTVGSTQARLADLQNSIYSSERIKKIEAALGKVLDKLPEDAATAFLDHYEGLLRKI
jgi:hypothetical protein